jgi:DNA-binding protein H-NS
MTSDFEALTADELYLLHREVAAVLRKKLEPRKMPWRSDCGKYSRPMNTRLPITSVLSTAKAKFRNPDQPSETWSGRGRRPRWLDVQLRSGKRIEDFRTDCAAS